jgi:hypothetical protein
MTANVLASSAEILGSVEARFCLSSRCVLRSVDAVDSGLHATNRRNANERKVADAHEETMTTRCVVQNVSSSATGGSGGGGDGSGGGGGGGADGRGMDGAEGEEDCANPPTTNNDRRGTHFMLISNGRVCKKNTEFSRFKWVFASNP